jgi:CRISPR-associated protein Csm3
MSKKLIAKIFITGKLRAETGLHIGGSKSSLDIGGVDLNVIKSPKGEPFIPGSSLKGKLRSMLARVEGSIAVNRREIKDISGAKADEDFDYLNQLFGSSGDERDKTKSKGEVSRLIVRDAALDVAHFEDHFDGDDLDLDYTTVKWENTIDRRKGTAEHPRQLERVPAGSLFDFELVYDLYDDHTTPYQPSASERTGGRNKGEQHAWALATAMQLLQDDYLGGQGTRGYGKVRFDGVTVTQKVIDLQNGQYKPSPDVEAAFKSIENYFA